MESPTSILFDNELPRAVSEQFWLKAGAPIYIYGTGTVGQEVSRIFSDKAIPIEGYMDHRIRSDPNIDKVPIISPDSVDSSKRGKAIIILAIHNREVDMRALIARLKAMGYKQLITMIDLYDHFADELGARYWLTSRNFYRGFKTQIDAANKLWADDLSCDVYEKTLHFRINGDFSLLPEPDIAHQYFPPGLPPWKQPIRMIDCGAYDGDVIRDFIKIGFTFSALAAFEPDAQNYSRLAKYIQEHGITIPEVSLWPCGVGAISRQLSFASGMGEASGIAASGETVIQCVALDDALPNFAPTLIKMDIEGAEIDALMGARQLILTYRPALILSAYHTPAHLWEIPLWVAQLAAENGLKYHYYLRTHAYNCFDTVFYAVPNI